jgi:hypothetical protein
LTKITAGERLGLVFLFVILAQYDEGWEILSAALLKQGFSTLSHVLHVFEGMLCFDAWTNKEFCWSIEHHDEAKAAALESIKELLRDCQDHIPLGKKSHGNFQSIMSCCIWLRIWNALGLLLVTVHNVQNPC